MPQTSNRSVSSKRQVAIQKEKERKRKRLSLPSTIDSTTCVNPEKVEKRRLSRRLSNSSLLLRNNSNENKENSGSDRKQGPTPYIQIVLERGGEMSPRLTRSSTKKKKKRSKFDKPPLARKDGISLFEPTKADKTLSEKDNGDDHNGKTEDEFRVFTPPHSKSLQRMDSEEASDLTSDSGSENSKQATVNAKQLEQLSSELKLMREQHLELLQAKQDEHGAQAMVDRLVNEKVALVEERANLRNELQQAKDRLSSLQSTADADMEEIAETNERLESENVSLATEVEKITERATSLEKELDLLERETLPAAQAKLASTEENLRTQKHEATKLQNEVVEYKAQIQQVSNDLTSTREELDNLRNAQGAEMQSLEQMKTENSVLTERFNNVSNENKSLQSTIEDLEARIKDFEQSLDVLQNQKLPEKDACLKEARDEVETQRQQQCALEAELSEYKAMSVKLQEELAQNKCEYEEQNNKELEELAERNEQLEIENENSRRDNEALKQEIEVLRNRVKTIETDRLPEAEARLTAAQNDLCTEKERVVDLETTLASLTTKLTDIEEMHEKERQNFKEMNKQSSMVLEKLRAEGSSSKDTLQNLESKLKAKDEQVAVLSETSVELEHMKKVLEDALQREQALKQKSFSLQKKLEATTRERNEAQQIAATSGDQHKQIHQRLIESDQIRRDLHAKVMQLLGNIRVFVRVRPLLPEEKEEEGDGNKSVFKVPSISGSNCTDLTKRSIELVEPKKDRGGLKERRTRHRFAFDDVFEQNHGQDDVWQSTEPLIQSALDGFNVSLFAYGQTGSGKTFTMLGGSGYEGIIPRAIKKIFGEKNKVETLSNGSSQVRVQVEMLEIYNEQVRDLFASSESNESPQSLKVNMTTHKVEGNQMIETNTVEECMELLGIAQKRRCVKSTSSNTESSRSHLVFTIHYFVIENDTEQRKGKLNICDLAGSERLSKSEAHFVGGALLQETKNINKSLSVLSNVIEQLQAGNQAIAYRDSKLTSLLCDSLGGNSKTLAIVCCNPMTSHYHESLSSLRFAEKASKVELKASSSFRC